MIRLFLLILIFLSLILLPVYSSPAPFPYGKLLVIFHYEDQYFKRQIISMYDTDKDNIPDTAHLFTLENKAVVYKKQVSIEWARKYYERFKKTYKIYTL